MTAEDSAATLEQTQPAVRDEAAVKTGPSHAGKKPLWRRGLRWWPVLLAVSAVGCVALAKENPQLTERFFSRGFYQAAASVLGRISSLVPFSLVEMLILLLPTLAIVFFVMGVVEIVRRRGKRSEPAKRINWRRSLGVAVRIGCCVLSAFILLCGLNYYRPTFTEMSGLTIRDSSAEELAALCRELALEANDLRAQLTADENGVMKLEEGVWSTARIARDTFGTLSETYEVLPDYRILPKPVLNSWWMSMMQITGVFCPYTFEANINVSAPAYGIPSTMCHELAHTRGFMREDEANFIAYLACTQSDSPEFAYSGVMLGLIHSLNRLYSADSDLYHQVDALCSQEVKRDFAANNAYWARHDGPVAKVSDAVNNVYLKANNQSDGVQSYGRMVDLLLADYRQRYGLD